MTRRFDEEENATAAAADETEVSTLLVPVSSIMANRKKSPLAAVSAAAETFCGGIFGAVGGLGVGGRGGGNFPPIYLLRYHRHRGVSARRNFVSGWSSLAAVPVAAGTLWWWIGAGGLGVSEPRRQ